MKQTDFSDFGGGSPEEAEDEEESEGGFSRMELAMRHAPDDAEPFADDSCPWCLAPAERFNERNDGVVGCGHCDARIPVDAEWYQDGKKMCF